MVKKDTINIRPLGDKVLIEVNKEDGAGKTKSGFLIPDTVKGERPEEGVVVAVGPGRRLDDGTLVPINLKPGQKVVFSKYGPDEIKVGDTEYLIVSESNILATID